jgi:hypothetical protein
MKLETLGPALSDRLRAEAQGMGEAYLDALLAACPEDAISGVYAKGSAYRPWDTAIDYVPELSDVDIHVRLAPEEDQAVRAMPFALDVGEAALGLFQSRFPRAVHVPRPQLFFLGDLERLRGYLPSPSGCVHTLFGQEYSGASRSDYADCQVADGQRFSDDARFMVNDLPGQVIDRPGRLLWRAVATITWRVGPAEPRLLTQLAWIRTTLGQSTGRRSCGNCLIVAIRSLPGATPSSTWRAGEAFDRGSKTGRLHDGH